MNATRPHCGHAAPQAGCRFCAAGLRDPRYAALFWGPPAAPAAQAPRGTAAPPGPPPCRHRGAPTGGVVDCDGCGLSGKTTPLSACAVHDECTTAKPGSRVVEGVRKKVAYCRGCPQHEPPDWPKRFDERNLWVGVPGKRFNSAVMEYEGGYLFASRNGWAGSEIYLGRFDSDFRPVGRPWMLKLRVRRESRYGAEDPYLFRFGGAIHVGFVGVEGANKLVRTHSMYARLSADLQVEAVFHPRYAGRAAWEKSHGYFEHGGRLYAVYSVNPRHRVLAIEGERADLAFDEPGVPWPHQTSIRGGAAPLRVGDEFWSFGHSRWERPRRRYFMTLYAFSPEPPFRVLRYAPGPVVEADPATNVGADRNYCDVYFPRGAVATPGGFVVSAGVHDRFTELRRFDHAELEGRMVSL